MMIDHDPILRELGRVTVLSPNERRAELIRARCRATWQHRLPARRRRIAPALVAGVCVAYLFALVHDMLLLRGWF